MTLSLNKIRKMNHLKHRKSVIKHCGFDMDNWRQLPYTYIKSKYYIETSSIIVFISQFTKITPNFLTLVFVTLSAFGGLFLASNNDTLIYIGLFFLFSKGSFDWADGLLAVIKKKTSKLGALLDNWGGLVGSYSYLCGFGIYLYNKNQEELFIILSFLIILIKALDLKDYSYHLAMYQSFHENKKSKLNKKNISSKNKLKNIYGVSVNLIKIKNFFQNFLDERSRSIDFVCLVILFDSLYVNTIFLTILNYIYYLIFLKTFILFSGGFYITYFKNFSDKIK